ncbi:ArsR family transcriptional regulator, partial [Escherichia coli]|nr:ArsR family transcriptional regulator [Escherichia coli]
LVTVENLRGFYVVTLTSRGQDVAEGRARIAGVKRPRPRA